MAPLGPGAGWAAVAVAGFAGILAGVNRSEVISD